MTQKRNGEIDFFRFVFALCIMLHHFNISYNFGRFKNGSIGVEFFFIVTGVLMAKSAKSVKIEKNLIPNYTYSFMKRKICVFYPYFISVILLNMVFLRILVNKNSFFDVVKNIIRGIPTYFLFHMNGIMYNGNMELGGGWYLSAMVLALFFLYPILLYNYEWATKIIFPIIGITGLGILFINFGSIIVVKQTLFMVGTGGVLRAISEIALGAWSYEIALKFKREGVQFTKLSAVFLTIIKYACFIGVLFYAFYGFSSSYSPIVFIFCLLGIMLSFSEMTVCIPSNSLTRFLGKYSLLVYITHQFFRALAVSLFGTTIEVWKLIIIILITIIGAYMIMIFTDFCIKFIKKYKYLFIEC